MYMATMPKILVEVGPHGLGDILIGAEGPAARSRALRFLAGKMESLGRLDRALRSRPTGLNTGVAEQEPAVMVSK